MFLYLGTKLFFVNIPYRDQNCIARGHEAPMEIEKVLPRQTFDVLRRRSERSIWMLAIEHPSNLLVGEK